MKFFVIKFLLIFSSDPDFSKNVVVLNEKDNFARMREAFKFLYGNHLHDFDWLLKVEDSTFIVMENLRYLLYQYDTNWPLIIGQRFLAEDYMIGTYVLSKKAFTRFVEHSMTNKDFCVLSGNSIDIDFSHCLNHIDVIKVDGLDDDKKGMFFQSKPEYSLFPTKYDQNFDKFYLHKLKQGFDNCCSDRIISIHNFRDKSLYYLEYYIYKVRMFGRHRLREELPRQKKLTEIINKYY